MYHIQQEQELFNKARYLKDMLLSSSDVYLRAAEGFTISKSFRKETPWHYDLDPDQENI